MSMSCFYIEHENLEAKLSEPTVRSTEGQGKCHYSGSQYILDSGATDTVQIIDECPPMVSIEGLRHDSVEIEGLFANVAASIYRSLITRSVAVDRLKACMMGFNCRTKVYDGSDQSMFRKQRRKFDEPSATVTKVWNIIGEYFSFFDYDILELIANTLGTEQDKENVVKYKTEFAAYARRRLVIDEEASGKSPGTNEQSSPDSAFVILDSSYDDCEIGDIKRLQKKLSKIFNLKDGVLQLRKVRKNCVQLVFEIPDFLVHIVFPLLPDQESALGELGVTKLDCGDYHFMAKV